jgi:hypothetical protein
LIRYKEGGGKMVIIISITPAIDGTFRVVWSDNGKQYKAYLFTSNHIQELKA